MTTHVRTIPIDARPGSALDPLAEEISWRAWSLDAVHPPSVDESTLRNSTGAFRWLLEAAWRPGRAVLVSEVAADPSAALPLSVRFAVGSLGPTGSTARELDPLVPRVEKALGAGGARRATTIDPAAMLSSEPDRGRHCAHLHQALWAVGDEQDLVEVVSRFQPTLEPWSGVAGLAARWDAPLAVRATVLATDLSPADRLDLRDQLRAVESLRSRNVGSPEVAFDAERARVTLLDLWASLGSPLFVLELALRSPEPLPETLIRSVGAHFTSETDVLRQRGQVEVATGPVMLGGAAIEREPREWDEAWRLGLPLRGGLGPRALRHLVTLREAPIGWPLPLGDTLNTVPVHVPSAGPVPSILTPGEGRPATVVGTTAEGEQVAVPLELRTRHCVVTGTWGAGKSTFLLAHALDDLRHGRPLVFIDPHGTAATELVAHAQHLGLNPVVLDPLDGRTERLGFLPALGRSRVSRAAVETASRRVTEGIASSLPNPDWTGPRFVALLGALLEVVSAHRAELADGAVWLNDPAELTRHIAHPLVSELARSTLANVTGRGDDAASVRGWAASKLHPLAHGTVRRILAPAGRGIDVAKALAAGHPIITSLNGMSETEISLVGHLVVQSGLDGAFARSPTERVNPWTFYVDEAHLLPSRGQLRVLAEARKFGFALYLSTQAVAQLAADLADLALGAGTTACFRATPDTAWRLAGPLGASVAELTALPDLTCVLGIQGHGSVRVELPPVERCPVPYERAEPRAVRSRRPRPAVSPARSKLLDDDTCIEPWLADS